MDSRQRPLAPRAGFVQGVPSSTGAWLADHVQETERLEGAAELDAFRYLKLSRVLRLQGPINPVFRVFCDHADYRSGRCKLRYSTIAAEAGLSKSTARRAVAELEAMGLIEVVADTKQGSRKQGANRYRIRGGVSERAP